MPQSGDQIDINERFKRALVSLELKKPNSDNELDETDLNDDELVQIVRRMPLTGRRILFLNSVVDTWGDRLRANVEDFEPKNILWGRNVAKFGMSAARTTWFLLSHVYLVETFIKIPLSTKGTARLAPPLNPTATTKHLKEIIKRGLLKQEIYSLNGSYRCISITPTGRQLVEDEIEDYRRGLDAVGF